MPPSGLNSGEVPDSPDPVKSGNPESPETTGLSMKSPHPLDVSAALYYNVFCTMCRCSSVVEQRIRNARVGGSNPLSGSSKIKASGDLLRTFFVLVAIMVANDA